MKTTPAKKVRKPRPISHFSEVHFSHREVGAIVSFNDKPGRSGPPLIGLLTTSPANPASVVVNIDVGSGDEKRSQVLNGELPVASLPALIEVLTLLVERGKRDGVLPAAR